MEGVLPQLTRRIASQLVVKNDAMALTGRDACVMSADSSLQRPSDCERDFIWSIARSSSPFQYSRQQTSRN